MHYSEAEEKSKTKKKILKMARERKYVPPIKTDVDFSVVTGGIKSQRKTVFKVLRVNTVRLKFCAS